MSQPKRRVLESTVALLQNRYGNQAIRRASEVQAPRKPEHISSGFAGLDAITGCDGLPLGALTLLSGAATSGIVTLAYKALLHAQQSAPKTWQYNVAILDLNDTFDADYVARCGVDLDKLLLIRPQLETTTVDLLAIRVAVAAAGFSPGEADLLRRALSRKNSAEAMQQMEQRFLLGAAGQGIDESTARTIFQQLAGFAGYGFPKSHAASFALIAYQTLWLKCYHPAAFYCSLFNAQPMGFYSTEVIAGDAKRHGVALLPPDIHHSIWRSSLERTDAGTLAIRMGLSTVAGFGEEGWQRIEQAKGSFTNLQDFVERTRLPRDVITNLIRAGTLAGFGERRSLLWQLGEIDDVPNPLGVNPPAIPVTLPALAPLEQTLWEQELLGLSPTTQLVSHYHEQLRQQGALPIWQVKEQPAGKRLRVGGMVVVRQRPATAHGILFMSLEDTSGLLDLVVKPDVYTRLREVLRHELLIVVEGVLQRSGGSVNVLLLDAQSL